MRAGVKSLTVLYRDQTKQLLWRLLTFMTLLLIACGVLSGMNFSYHLFGVGGATTALALMIAKVELKTSESCWWWFSKVFWFAGGSITGGLLLEYLYEVFVQ